LAKTNRGFESHPFRHVNRIPNQSAAEPGKTFIAAVAVLFFVISTWVSYARWANFECRTFDLAYYAQGIWQFLHGRFAVSVIGVPLLGNHVEPIVFLFAPLIAVFRHPMLFVAVQNAALATMGPVGFSIARRLGLDGKSSALAASALLLAPAAGYIALHEFHPEALSAPLLLLMLQARLTRKLGKHWLWFIAVLACKENMALLLIAYCAIHCVAERKLSLAELRAWFLWPMAVAILWFIICAEIITPALNSGNVDYIALYDRLGASPIEILRNAIAHPQLIANALVQSLTHGNLVWALLLPFLGLPLLRPRWLIVAAPILLQHLLSWRASEWTIYFHYAAPLLPLFWIAYAEVVASSNLWKRASESIPRALFGTVIIACVAAQIFWGPAAAIGSTTADWFAKASDRARKNAFIANISPQASVVAPFPYLSHLAMREKLYSLHHILKGLKTLSHQVYEQPPPTDFVLIDYLDSATFDAASGYYHPTMKTADGRIVPSSDRLLYDFLRRTSWVVNSLDELVLFRKGERTGPAQAASPQSVFEIATHTQLISITKSAGVLSNHDSVEIRLDWRFQGEREVFPWMLLRLTRRGGESAAFMTKGLCAPEAGDGPCEENWRITSVDGLASGDYSAEAIFVDNSKRAWSEATGQNNSASTLLSRAIPLGDLKVVRDPN
jgi:uncharacterized membrane protein